MKFSNEINIGLNKLSTCDNYHMPMAVFTDWTIIFFAIMLSEHSFYFYPLTIFIIGSRQRALATVLHEASHNLAAQSRTLNFLLGTLFSGYWIFQCFGSYRKSHVALHHGCLGNINKDPDFQFYVSQGLYQGINQKKFFISQVLSPFLFYKTIPYLTYLFKHRFTSFNCHKIELMFFSFFWFCVLSILISMNIFSFLLIYWIVPYLTTFIIIGHFIELAEHFPLLGESNFPEEMSRNRFSHPLEAFFFSIHSEHLHLTHHLRPGIPFWHLKKAHALMLQNPRYREINESFGGIFFSKDADKLAFIPALLQKKIRLPNS